MSRLSAQAFPSPSQPQSQPGFTKRDLACIKLRIPETGDPELDALIAKAQRRDLAKAAMQGTLARRAHPDFDPTKTHTSDIASEAVKLIDAILAELGKQP